MNTSSWTGIEDEVFNQSFWNDITQHTPHASEPTFDYDMLLTTETNVTIRPISWSRFYQLPETFMVIRTSENWFQLSTKKNTTITIIELGCKNVPANKETLLKGRIRSKSVYDRTTLVANFCNAELRTELRSWEWLSPYSNSASNLLYKLLYKLVVINLFSKSAEWFTVLTSKTGNSLPK